MAPPGHGRLVRDLSIPEGEIGHQFYFRCTDFPGHYLRSRYWAGKTPRTVRARWSRGEGAMDLQPTAGDLHLTLKQL